MKKKTLNFYEKYWKKENIQTKTRDNELIKGITRITSDEPLFEEQPVWGNIEEELHKRANFFRTATKGKVLDAGCGLGDWVFYLSKYSKVTESIGLDLSNNVIKKCIKKARKEQNKKVKFVRGSVTNLPFKDNYFDSIFSFEVAEHILDINMMLSEFNRVMKKNGYLGISTIDFNLIKKIIVGVFFFEKYFDPRSPHIRFFTKKTLEKILNLNGFEVKNYKWIKSYFGIMPMGQIMLAQKVREI